MKILICTKCVTATATATGTYGENYLPSEQQF